MVSVCDRGGGPRDRKGKRVSTRQTHTPYTHIGTTVTGKAGGGDSRQVGSQTGKPQSMGGYWGRQEQRALR